MAKKYTVTDAEIQHYFPPEVRGPIVGMREDHTRPKTVEEIEAIHKQAYEDGFKQGHEEGYREGHKIGHDEMQVQVDDFKARAQQLQTLIDFLNQPLKDMDQQVEQQLADLAVVLAKYLLKKESSLEAEHIYTLVHDSLEYLPVKTRNICIRLNPDDIALLNQAEIDIDNQSWSYVSDTSITAGGCMIESDTSHIDATVETRLQQLVEQLELHQAIDSAEDAGEQNAPE